MLLLLCHVYMLTLHGTERIGCLTTKLNSQRSIMLLIFSRNLTLCGVTFQIMKEKYRPRGLNRPTDWAYWKYLTDWNHKFEKFTKNSKLRHSKISLCNYEQDHPSNIPAKIQDDPMKDSWGVANWRNSENQAMFKFEKFTKNSKLRN
jgi:hypothetical protein